MLNKITLAIIYSSLIGTSSFYAQDALAEDNIFYKTIVGDGKTIDITTPIDWPISPNFKIGGGFYIEGNSNILNIKSDTKIHSTEEDTNTIGIEIIDGGGNTITNQGIMSIDSKADSSPSVGMKIGASNTESQSDNNTLINNGKIITNTAGNGQPPGQNRKFSNSAANAIGMEVSRGDNNTLINNGLINSATSGIYNDAWGMNIDSGSNNTLINQGKIDLLSSGDHSNATGINVEYGKEATSTNKNNIINTGSIIATTKGNESWATGINIDESELKSSSTKGDNLDIGGTLQVIANGDSSSARGLRFYKASNNNVVLSGNIDVKVTGSDSQAYGVDLSEGSKNNTVTNTGTISVSAGDDSSSTAYGIFIGNDNDNNIVNNYGTINVSGKNAYEVGGNNYEVKDYVLTMRDFGNGLPPFQVDDGGKISFKDTQFTLRLNAKTGFILDKKYSIKDLVNGEGNIDVGTINAQSELPGLLTAEVTQTDNSATTFKTNDQAGEDTQISIHTSIDAHHNLDQKAKLQAFESLNNQVSFIDSVLANQVINYQSTHSWNAFVTPYINHSKNRDQNYSAHSNGIMLGTNFAVNNGLTLGFHGGYISDNGSGDMLGMNVENKTALIGLHSFYNLSDLWILRAQLTGYSLHNKQRYNNGLEQDYLSSDTTMNGRGLYARMTASYLLLNSPNSMLVPEFGLSWLYNHDNGYDLKWKYSDKTQDASAYDMTIKSQNTSVVYANMMLRWKGNYKLTNKSYIQPILGIGVQERITGSIKSNVSMLNNSFITSAKSNQTAGNIEAGINWRYNNTTVGLSYTGNYGNQASGQTGWLNIGYQF